jgi:hypothetical protein
MHRLLAAIVISIESPGTAANKSKQWKIGIIFLLFLDGGDLHFSSGKRRERVTKFIALGSLR